MLLILIGTATSPPLASLKTQTLQSTLLLRTTMEIATHEREAVVKSADMPDEMRREAIDLAQHAMNNYKLEKDMAAYMKEEFDRKHYPSWHCVVGRNFGSYVTHETNRFIYFYIAHVAFMLYKTGF